MSDLTATNCGCNNNSCGCGYDNRGGLFGGNSCIWILLLLFCGGNGGCGNGILGGNSCGNGNDCCEWLIWILLISCLCGGNNGCGNATCNNNSCGCC